MTATRVVHVRERVPGATYIGRAMPRQRLKASPFANPFRIGRDGTRAEVIEQYRAWLLGQPDLLARVPELRGQVLACWCKPEDGFRGQLLCHGQVLAALADGIAPETVE